MQHLQRMKPRTAAGLEGRRKSLSPGCCLQPVPILTATRRAMGTGVGEVREQTGGEGISMMCAPLLSNASEAQMVLWVGSSGACATGRTEFAVIFLGAQYILTFSQGHGKKKTPTFLK